MLLKKHLTQNKGLKMNKEKIKSLMKKCENELFALGLVFIVIFFLFITGSLDSIHYFRRSSVVETVTYNEDSSVRPIYLS